MIEVRDRAELPEEAPDLESPDEIQAEDFGGRDRDIFALGAMIGLLAHGFRVSGECMEIRNPAAVAEQAFRMADAMVAIGERTQPRRPKG